jgi:hypothetical protein
MSTSSANHGPQIDTCQPDDDKARAAQNALKTGLFAAHDFIRFGEEEEYAELRASLLDELQPDGSIEEAFASEIVGAAWRLRRCRLIEGDFSIRTVLDPMVDEPTSHEQKSVDRARIQSHNLMRRSMAELRKVQTERTMRVNLKVPAHETPGLTESKQILHGLALWDTHLRSARKASEIDTLEGLIAKADRQLCEDVASSASDGTSGSSFCKSANEASPQPKQPIAAPKPIGRNAPCPCKSGQKFKRCCGAPRPTPSAAPAPVSLP